MSDVLANRYRILGELGQGGMGTVYRVADTLQDGRVMALKTIRSTRASSTELQLRFKEEFRVMASLCHPNTVTVFDFGLLDETTRYFTMELVGGQALSGLIRGEPLSFDQILRYLIQLLQGLGFIHTRRFVHRDIKADNIRVTPDGVVKLIDFGLMEQLGLPANGKITGTIDYLPPEVVRGGVIDATSDLYSVGCLAFEMVAGRPPFVGDPLAVIRAHVETAPPALQTLRGDVPPRLDAIIQRLLAKDQARRYPSANDVIDDLADLAGLTVTRESLAQKRSYLTSSVLVGREKELRVLEQALAEVRDGQGQSIFLAAPAGIGKSRLAQELALHAKLDDAVVLQTRCLESGMAPYEALTDALRPLLAHTEAGMLGRHGPILCKLFPELASQGIAASPALEVNAEKARLTATVVTWLRDAAGRRPVLLHLDDLQWCDLQSLETFNACIRELRTCRFFALGAFRSDETPLSSPIWFTIGDKLTRQLNLEPFTMVQAMLLLQAMLHELTISRDFSQFLYQSTAGNAFFLTEVLRYLVEEDILTRVDGSWRFPAEVGGLELPSSLEATVLRRLRQLTPDAVRLARVAATIGRSQEREMLLVVSGFDEERLFAALDELAERQYLIKEATVYSFAHDKVREVLYDDTEAAERQALHQHCGEFIEQRWQERSGTSTTELAYHFGRSGSRHKAYAYLQKAGDEAKAFGQEGIALDYWHQADLALEAIELRNKETVQFELWWNIGQTGLVAVPDLAEAAMGKCVRLLEAQGNIDRLAAVMKRVVALLTFLPAKSREAVLVKLSTPQPYHHRPRKGLGRLLPPSPAAWAPKVGEAHGLLCVTSAYTGNPTQGIASGRRALSLLPTPGTPVEGMIQTALGGCYYAAGRFDELRAATDRARELLFDRDLGNVELLLSARAGCGFIGASIGFQGYRQDPALFEASERTAREIQALSLLSAGWALQGVWYALTGRLDEALERVEATAANSRRIGTPPYQLNLFLRPLIHVQRGQWEEALALVQQALRYPHIASEFNVKLLIDVLHGEILLALGQPAAARAALTTALGVGRQRQLLLVVIRALIALGQVARHEEKWAEARDHLEEAYRISATGIGRNPLHQAISGRLLGDLVCGGARRAGDPAEFAEARQYYDEALAIVSDPQQDNLIEQGRLYLALGDWHLAQDDRDAARVMLEMASERFLAIRNRHELRAVRQRLDAFVTKGDPVDGGPIARQERRDPQATVSDWQMSLSASLDLLQTAGELHQAVLKGCLQATGADEASLYRTESGIQWQASRDRTGSCEEPATNVAFIRQVLREGVGLCAIDMPPELVIDKDSTVETAMPSVVLAPIARGRDVAAVLYLTRHNIANPFAEADVAQLAGLEAYVGKILTA